MDSAMLKEIEKGQIIQKIQTEGIGWWVYGIEINAFMDQEE